MLKRRFSVQWLMTCHPLLRVEPSWLYWNISLSPEKMYGPWQKNCGRHLGDFKFQPWRFNFGPTTPTNKTHYDLDASYVNEEATPAPSGVLRSVHWHTRCGVKGRRIMDNRESNGGEGGQRLETQNKYGLGGVPPWIRDVGGYQNTSVLRVLLR
ncbi:hypothetical protein B0H13DRAFT_1870614 [Mycena leptocephala]|nr:hypothetical protein B0H13DRAFT_1870614 [Mycena leptocephala]